MGLLERLRRSSHIHGDVAERFARYLASGRVLDIPVGGGDNARPLAAAGYDVLGADIVIESLVGQGYEVQKIDMTQPLPFPDASFDAILHSEGIEHVDNQVAVLEELARVLKPGGVMIVTTPNLLHLEGRVLNLLTGHARDRGVVAESAGYWGNSESYAKVKEIFFGHVFLINAFQLRFYLVHAGLEVVEVDTTRYSWKSVVLAPLLYPFVWYATRRILRSRRSRLHPDQQREIRQQILSPALLFGRKAIMVARKPLDADADADAISR